MTTFDRREEAFEAMFAHDEEMHFKASVRRAQQLAGWAGGLMNLTPEADLAYKQTLAAFAVSDGTEQAMFARVRQDLTQAGAPVSDEQIRVEMDRLMAEATRFVRQN